jgi:Flp pilus assembly protein TadD
LKEALLAYDLAIEKGHVASSYMGRAIILSGQGDKEHARADLAAAKKLDADIEDHFADYGLKLQ